MKAEEIRPITFSDGAVLKIAEVKAGFPSPAADFTGETIDLRENASAFFDALKYYLQNSPY